MPLMVWLLPKKGERLAVLAARVIALGNGDLARTQTLHDGFFAELELNRFEAAEVFRDTYGDMVVRDPRAGDFAFSIARRNTALAEYHRVIASDRAERDWPDNVAVANVTGVLIVSIHDGIKCGVYAAIKEVGQQFKRIGTENERARKLSYISSRNTIHNRWSKRRGIAHLLFGLNHLDAGDISEKEFPGFCERARLMLSSNGPRNSGAGSVYVLASEQISVICPGMQVPADQ